MKPCWIVLVILAALLCSACAVDSDDNDAADGDSDPPADDDTTAGDSFHEPYRLAIVGGNFQAGLVGEELPDPLEIRLTDADGEPVLGQRMRFIRLTGADEGRATFSMLPASTVTDAHGIASCTITIGDTPGMLRVRAELGDNSAWPVTFHASAYPAPTSRRRPICFLSINDLHAHVTSWGHPNNLQGGVARIVRLMQTVRANNARVGVETVIVDAGDDFENTLYNDIPGFLEWLIATWDRAGVDVWQVGNHDFHFGIPLLTEKLLEAQKHFTIGAKGHPMRIVFGNIDPRTMKEEFLPWAEDFEVDFNDSLDEKLYQQTTILEKGPIRVGILGAVTEVGVYTQVPGDPLFLKLMGAPNPYAQGATFFNPDPRKHEYINTGIDNLVHGGAHAVVVTSHVGLGFGDRVNIPPGKDHLIAQYGCGARSGRVLDLLIGAHSHVQLNKPVLVRNPRGTITPIVQAREGGLFAARVDAVVDVVDGGMEMLDSRLVQINSDLPEDPQTAVEVEQWKVRGAEQYGNWFDTELIASDCWLSHRAETISGLGSLINDAFEWMLAEDESQPAVDGAIAVPSLYRADIWPGVVTAERAYDVLPLHKMDLEGHAPDTITIMAFQPGLLNASMLLVPGTWNYETTAIEYALEVIHSLPDILDLIPPLGEQLNIQVIQISGVEYEVDMTAPMFRHVVPGSVLINGEPPDPEKVYQVALVHSMAHTLVYALNRLVVAEKEGEGLVKILLDDPVTGEPMHDTGIPIWLALQEYLDALPVDVLPREDVTITGADVRTIQPDLTVNSTEIDIAGAARGETATVSVLVRNNGLQGVRHAVARVYVDATPWDQTDQPDGRSELEGLGANYIGSWVEIAREEIAVGPHPDVAPLLVDWDVPDNWPPGMYTAHVRIDEITCDEIDANTGLPYADAFRDNHWGEQVMAYFEIE
ncbi:MAG: hypothetical protein P9L99_08570 [Candidatus Lernaella stagnicola]|nr:hypothetical protein [Candidatus Lernaella stagnicola]